MKPSFSTLWTNYPHKTHWSQSRLFHEIGWDDLIGKRGWDNTCAVRTSYALQKSGVPVRSSAGMTALAGAIKGKAIEIRHDDLARQLLALWGAAEKLPGSDAEKAIGSRDGLVVFWEIASYALPGGGLGGHIDLIDGRDVYMRKRMAPFLFFFEREVEEQVTEPTEVGSGLYFNCKEVWFWELA